MNKRIGKEVNLYQQGKEGGKYACIQFVDNTVSGQKTALTFLHYEGCKNMAERENEPFPWLTQCLYQVLLFL